jgi:Tannase and feruloyl esterase
MTTTVRALMLSTASLTALAMGAAPAAAKGASCASLASLSLPNTTIVSAASYAAAATITGTTTAPVALCRVVGKLTPSSDSNINFEVWMPTSGWTGRYEQVGNGGFAGAIMYNTMRFAAGNNNATASTDDGSSQPPGNPGGFFALGHPEKIIDYGHRAVHLTNVAAKRIVEAFYGQPPQYSYFDGCSKGGQESLMEAQRYPHDFDGILGGAAASDWTPLFSGFDWDAQAVADTNRPGFLPTANLAAMSGAANAQCLSAKLFATDNFFNDPRQCHFNAQAMLCTGAPNSSCLTQPQIDGVNAVLNGPKTSQGVQIAPGYEPEFATEWPGIITGGLSPIFPNGVQGFFGNGFYTNFITPPITLDPPGQVFNVDTSPQIALKEQGANLNAYNPDLTEFERHGGKLIQYHGWADPLVAPKFSVNYFKSVVNFHRGQQADRHDDRDHNVHRVSFDDHGRHDVALARTQHFFRLFMAPGMGHCGGGPGLNAFGQNGQNGGSGPASSDIFTALEKWVEQGVPPEQIIATGGTAPNTFTRPLCVYPKKAAYVSGDPTVASSFTCKSPDFDD